MKVEMFEELHNEKAEIVKQERVKVCDKIHHEVVERIINGDIKFAS